MVVLCPEDLTRLQIPSCTVKQSTLVSGSAGPMLAQQSNEKCHMKR